MKAQKSEFVLLEEVIERTNPDTKVEACERPIPSTSNYDYGSVQVENTPMTIANSSEFVSFEEVIDERANTESKVEFCERPIPAITPNCDKEDQEKTTTTATTGQWPLCGIKEPNDNDFICGGGASSINHPGNRRYKKIIEDRKLEYINSEREDKSLVALEIIHEWRKEQNPPGRFLKMDNDTGFWNDIGDKEASQKIKHALRDKARLTRAQQKENGKMKERKSNNKDEMKGETKTEIFIEATNSVRKPKPRSNRKRVLIANDNSLCHEHVKEDELQSLEVFSQQDPLQNSSSTEDESRRTSEQDAEGRSCGSPGTPPKEHYSPPQGATGPLPSGIQNAVQPAEGMAAIVLEETTILKIPYRLNTGSNGSGEELRCENPCDGTDNGEQPSLQNMYPALQRADTWSRNGTAAAMVPVHENRGVSLRPLTNNTSVGQPAPRPTLVKGLGTEDAKQHLREIQREFSDRPDVCKEFVAILYDLASPDADINGAIARVSKLFHCHHNLILGFNQFVPDCYKISVQDLQHQDAENIKLQQNQQHEDETNTTVEEGPKLKKLKAAVEKSDVGDDDEATKKTMHDLHDDAFQKQKPYEEEKMKENVSENEHQQEGETKAARFAEGINSEGNQPSDLRRVESADDHSHVEEDEPLSFEDDSHGFQSSLAMEVEKGCTSEQDTEGYVSWGSPPTESCSLPQQEMGPQFSGTYGGVQPHGSSANSGGAIAGGLTEYFVGPTAPVTPYRLNTGDMLSPSCQISSQGTFSPLVPQANYDFNEPGSGEEFQQRHSPSANDTSGKWPVSLYNVYPTPPGCGIWWDGPASPVVQGRRSNVLLNPQTNASVGQPAQSLLVKGIRVQNARQYLNDIQKEFCDQPNVYEEFVAILQELTSPDADTASFIARVSRLFHGRHNLILGFNQFLPARYKISLDDLQRQDAEIAKGQNQQQEDGINTEAEEGPENVEAAAESAPSYEAGKSSPQTAKGEGTKELMETTALENMDTTEEGVDDEDRGTKELVETTARENGAAAEDRVDEEDEGTQELGGTTVLENMDTTEEGVDDEEKGTKELVVTTARENVATAEDRVDEEDEGTQELGGTTVLENMDTTEEGVDDEDKGTKELVETTTLENGTTAEERVDDEDEGTKRLEETTALENGDTAEERVDDEEEDEGTRELVETTALENGATAEERVDEETAEVGEFGKPPSGLTTGACGATTGGRVGSANELQKKCAEQYMDDVEREFGGSGRVYHEFLTILRQFKTKELGTSISRLCRIFHGHDNLILRFNDFLPDGHKISTQDLQRRHAEIALELEERRQKEEKTNIEAEKGKTRKNLGQRRSSRIYRSRRQIK